MQSITLNVKGMTCMGCVRSVKNVVEPIGGVEAVDVSLEKGEVTVQYDPAQAKVDQFKTAIEDAGYDVVS
jgi:copper chaperone